MCSTKLMEKSHDYIVLKDWLHEGLLLSKGRKWHQRRKILTPAFHFKILEQFVGIFQRQANTFVEILSKCRVGEKMELYPHITRYALDVICETAMGTSINAQNNKCAGYVDTLKKLANNLVIRGFSALYRIDWIYRLSKSARINGALIDTLHDFTNEVIKDRRKELIANNTYIDENQNIGIKQKIAFLDILLQATIDGKPLTDSDIKEEVDTFMFEGHDTTSSGILFCMYNIAKYPHIQQRCLEEIRMVLEDDESKVVTISDLNNLNFLERVIKETLRLYPSVPIIGRRVNEEIVINNRRYPAGCNLILALFVIGRNPDIFEDPEEFRPERFEVEVNAEKMNPFAYVPFSGGARNCIGQKFAMLEMKSVLSKTLQRFQLSLDSENDNDLNLAFELILKPTNPIKFNLIPRT